MEDIWRFCQKYDLFNVESRVVIGLSGGPDSVFLLHLLVKLLKEKRIKSLIAVHLDHEWRLESSKDARFCVELARSLSIECVSMKVSELHAPFKNSGSQEEYGRNLRRYFFEMVCKKHGFDVVALGHHLQDQEETFFIRLIRGASLTGMTCMWPCHGLYVRPLLGINKSEIVEYLKTHDISYLQDPTNKEYGYLRNRIRNCVLPELYSVDDRFGKNFQKTLYNLQGAERYLAKHTQGLFSKITEVKFGKRFLSAKQLFDFDVYMQKRIIIYWLISEGVLFLPSDGLLNEILRFACSVGSKTHAVCESWSIAKTKDLLAIKKQHNIID